MQKHYLIYVQINRFCRGLIPFKNRLPMTLSLPS